MNHSVLLSYIDPMSGSILIQLIVAAVVGCLAMFRRTIWSVVSFVFRAKPSGDDHSA